MLLLNEIYPRGVMDRAGSVPQVPRSPVGSGIRPRAFAKPEPCHRQAGATRRFSRIALEAPSNPIIVLPESTNEA